MVSLLDAELLKSLSKKRNLLIFPYGSLNFSYLAAGEIEGLTKLVDAFYRIVDERSTAKKIRDMHPKGLLVSCEKRTYFLSGWLGRPKRVQEKYGTIRTHLKFAALVDATLKMHSLVHD